MLLHDNSQVRIRVFAGWRANGVLALVGAAVVAVAFLVFSLMIFLLPVLAFGAITSVFLPRAKIFILRKERSHHLNVIDAEYTVINPPVIGSSAE
jgi:uncharacterized membrane protein